MAPLKLEDHMKEQLEARKMAPSDAAWERLSGQLDVHQGKKKSNRVLWLAIAASFVAGVFITVLVLQQPEPTGTLVNTPEVLDDTNKAQEESPVLKDNVAQEQLVVVPESTEVNEEIVEKKRKTPIIKETQKKSSPVQFVKQEQAVAVIQNNVDDKQIIPKEEQPIDEIKFSLTIKNAITQKVNEVVAQVGDTPEITDKEIENLLQAAQQDIIRNKILNPQTNRVDATALLLDVEAEVDPASFRDKIFEGLKEGFFIARDAVANRNN